MNSLAPVLLFLLVMTLFYIATISQWGFLARQVRKDEVQRARTLFACALLSDARPQNAEDRETADLVVSDDHVDVSKT